MSDIKKTITLTIQEDVTVEKKCDVCFKLIEPVSSEEYPRKNIPYFRIITHHDDWGNDSCESYEYFHACCPECALKFATNYLNDDFNGKHTRKIKIEHRPAWFLPCGYTEETA